MRESERVHTYVEVYTILRALSLNVQVVLRASLPCTRLMLLS